MYKFTVSVPEKSLFQGAMKKRFLSVSEKVCFSVPRFSDFFGFRKIAFSSSHEEAIFSVSERTLSYLSFIQAPRKSFFSVSEKSLFRGATRKEFVQFSKHSYLRAL